GAWISDQTILLDRSASYRDFLVNATVPDRTASMTIWVWSGLGGSVTVDSFVLNRSGGDSSGENLLTNGGFETGDLSGLDTGGSVSLTSTARTGSWAARIGSESFVVLNRDVQPGEAYRFNGYYRTEGSGTDLQAGFSFWGSGGEWLGDSLVDLASSSSFTPFSVAGTVPDGAVSLSAWIWSGLNGVILADDLEVIPVQNAAAEIQSLSTQETGGTTSGETSGGVTSGGSEQGNETLIEFGTRESYSGLFYTDPGTGERLSGALSGLKLNANGTFSGRAIVDGRRLALRGRFDGSGTHRTDYRDGARMELQLIQNGASYDLRGYFTDTAGTGHVLRSLRAAYSKTSPTDLAGAYTMLLPGAESSDPTGFATVRVYPGGLVLTRGRLGDGRPFSHKGSLSDGQEWMLYRVMATKPELSQLGGTLTFRDTDQVSDFDGELQLTGPSSLTDEMPVVLPAIGSRFFATRGVAALESVAATDGEAICHLEEQGTSEAVDDWAVLWSSNNRLLGADGSRTLRGSVNL
ncbi:MAG: hypothetical protein KDL87_15970, partial [Verrucomicrobiae bacterium]|nr:hypothetical protein [Verrucomicrobiae bacterium]